MDRSELAGLSAEELIAKRDTIEEEIRKQHELLDMVRTRHASCWIHGVVSPIDIERLHDVTGGVASLNFDATELKIF